MWLSLALRLVQTRKGLGSVLPRLRKRWGRIHNQAAEVAAVSGESGPRGTQASGRPRPPGLPPQVAVRASFDLHRLYDRLYRSSQLIDFRKTNKNTSVAMSCSDYSVLWRKDTVGRTWVPLKISPQEPTETQRQEDQTRPTLGEMRFEGNEHLQSKAAEKIADRRLV